MRDGRIVVTANIGDFERIRSQWLSIGREPAPMIYVPDPLGLRRRRNLGRLVAAIEQAALSQATERRGGVFWIRSPTPKPR
jgi:hypothetical protein